MEKSISTADIMSMGRHQRRDFINTLSGIKSAQLIGTIDRNGVANLGVFNSVVHIGASPPYLGFIMRPLSVDRQTYNNIKGQKHYTFNQINVDIVEKAHQTAAKYPKGSSEFEATRLTPQFTESVRAPYVLESKIKMGLEFVEEQYIKANHTWLIIGKVVEVLLPQDAIEASGHLDLAQWGGVGVSGLDTYYQLDKLVRLGYPRP